jgi:hypothetical protein
MRGWISPLFLLLLSCGEKEYTAEQCKQLAELRPYLNRCMGGSIYGQYIGDLKCWPFAHQRLRGVLWGSGDENAAFYPNAKSYAETRKSERRIWPENDSKLPLPAELHKAAPGTPAAYLIDAEGQMSQCDAWFGHLGAYPREFIITKFYSIKEIPLR